MSESVSYLDLTKFNLKEFGNLARMSMDDRSAKIDSLVTKKFTSEDLRRIEPMTFKEEFVAVMLFLFGVPGAVFSIPVALLLIGLAIGSVWKAFAVGALIFAPLSILPASISDKALSSWYALQILRYFSFKCVFEEKIEKDKPYILVAPPHGVFPFGNIVTMIAFPSVMGFSFNGLAASAAIRMPIFRQLLSSVGTIDASRKVATKALNRGRTIGISTGGVAEVFETNSKSGDEVIVLKSRKGIVKLAFRTGASLVPCYLFGNTKLLSLWTGGPLHNFFRNLSRKIGFATIIFWGRFGLPIPYRVPIVGTMAKPIRVEKKDNPTDAEVEAVHKELCEAMVRMFDKHKAAYGWEKKKLVIL